VDDRLQRVGIAVAGHRLEERPGNHLAPIRYAGCRQRRPVGRSKSTPCALGAL
jgi:hypothetical protein